MRAGPYIASNIDHALATARYWRNQGNERLALQYEREATRWAAGTDYQLPPSIGDDPAVSVPRSIMQQAYDALEEVDDRWLQGSSTWTLAEQIDILLHPEKAR